MPDISGWADLPFFCLLFVHNIVSINLVGCSLQAGRIRHRYRDRGTLNVSGDGQKPAPALCGQRYMLTGCRMHEYEI